MAKMKRGTRLFRTFACSIPPRRTVRESRRRPKRMREWRDAMRNLEPPPSPSSPGSDPQGYSDQNNGNVGSTTGSNFYVRIPSIINREFWKPSASVAFYSHSNVLVDLLPPVLSQSEKPDVTFDDVAFKKEEIRKAVELPLRCHELYKRLGMDCPRGVLLFGPPGTGKTMLANAIANHTDAAFIRVVGSEFVQKYLGEGPRMVRDVFQLAKENTPAVIFIDEVDAIATARFDVQTEPDRKENRILMELLTQMDVLDQTVNVMVIMATNRADTLEPALLHPGRLGRKIEFTLPDREQKRLVFQVCTAKMNLSDKVELEEYVSRPDDISAAEIVAICREAGKRAILKNRNVILPEDFEESYGTNVTKGIEIPKYVDTVTPQYKPKFDQLLIELKEAEEKSLKESERLEKEIVEVQDMKKNISTMTANEYFEKNPELKKKFDDEIRNDYWGY